MRTLSRLGAAGCSLRGLGQVVLVQIVRETLDVVVLVVVVGVVVVVVAVVLVGVVVVVVLVVVLEEG